MSPTQKAVSEYLATFQELVDGIDRVAVEAAVERLKEARDQGGTVYIAGNGGSATTATHLANDLGKATKQSGHRPFRVLSMSDNISWLTALANDEGYERVFAGQLENFAQPGDILIVISASGNSPNIVEAVKLARERGVVSIGMVGFDGGKVKGLVDVPLWLESEVGAYGPVETGHSLLCDLLTTSLIEDRREARQKDSG